MTSKFQRAAILGNLIDLRNECEKELRRLSKRLDEIQTEIINLQVAEPTDPIAKGEYWNTYVYWNVHNE